MPAAPVPAGWPALAAFVVGFAAMVPFMDTTVYEGPVAAALKGGDLAYPVGFAVTGLLYWALQRRSQPLTRSRTPEESAPVKRRVSVSDAASPTGTAKHRPRFATLGAWRLRPGPLALGQNQRCLVSARTCWTPRTSRRRRGTPAAPERRRAGSAVSARNREVCPRGRQRGDRRDRPDGAARPGVLPSGRTGPARRRGPRSAAPPATALLRGPTRRPAPVRTGQRSTP